MADFPVPKPQPRPRSSYQVFRAISTRWMDNDAYGHVNNVVYYSWFDSAVNAHPVPRELITELLEVARRAPSGTNTQPWRVYVLQGASRATLVGKVCAAHDALYANPALAAEYCEEYDYYPEKWVSPYIDR